MTTHETYQGQPSHSRLYRDPRHGWIFGVCAGIATYFGVQRWVVRLITVIALFAFTLPTVLAYLGLAMFVPRAPETLYETPPEEEKFWKDVRVDPGRKFSELRHRFRELEQRLRSLEGYITSDGYRVQREINDLERGG